MRADTRAGDWCEERLHQPREDLDLARLFSPPGQRSRVAALAAIYIELEAIAAGRRDLNVARMKLGWWREELARLEAGRPEHPATKLLATGTAPTAVSRLLDLVTGMELNLIEGVPTEIDGACLSAERGCGQLLSILAGLANLPKQVPSERDFRRLGIGIGLARQLLLPAMTAMHDDIAICARTELQAVRHHLVTAPAPLRVLAALAWRRLARPAPAPSRRSGQSRRVFLAWRAARGHLPRDFGQSG